MIFLLYPLFGESFIKGSTVITNLTSLTGASTIKEQCHPEVALMEKHGLSEEDWNQKVSDIHVGDISRCLCEKWRYLYCHLDLDKIVVSDASRNHNNEADRRSAFFNEWREQQASEATYRKLVYALLRIDAKQDAVDVCKLLAKSLTKAKPPKQPSTATSSSSTTIPTGIILGTSCYLLNCARFN